MSRENRSILIGLLGPAISAAGLLWVVLKPALGSAPTMTFRYLVFDPGHMMIAAGILVSVICLPVAIQVATARPDELTPPDFEAGEPEWSDREEAPRSAGTRAAE